MLKKVRFIARGLGLCLLLAVSSANAGDKPRAASLKISVEPRDIGGGPFDWKAPTTDIEHVLRLVSEQLLTYFPGRELSDIRVRHREGFPETLFQRSRSGEHQVMLAARDRYWAQYTYQFAHELGHILTEPDHSTGRSQWFAEAMCETASLFVLSRMAEAWDARPPFPGAERWGINFERYVDDILAEPSRRLPPDKTMAQWLGASLPELAGERGLTDRSKLVAAYLLPIFVESPEGWESLTWWPAGEGDDQLEFEEYLHRWRGSVPERHRAFVGKIQELFGLSVQVAAVPPARQGESIARVSADFRP
jgi:hypothetical protein